MIGDQKTAEQIPKSLNQSGWPYFAALRFLPLAESGSWPTALVQRYQPSSFWLTSVAAIPTAKATAHSMIRRRR
jgi:hypothetical protein